ncbi:BTAD domain-containing putative transcriptional regulator [Nonomuraea sp. MCN248]|uniref:BTAD domain-containing putative transcriptional regulator n=1 Tax=Nonomuraea corallina TaxID=2989783 RepID=A0ABT4SIR1_9ACTN|nr:BTAD domain-containing putative transcriptional regulator [Nonomuraea corallina]MDA0637093.1 BTAD domain-containing putative transcriptional regulator [Nonomuraea corallina]
MRFGVLGPLAVWTDGGELVSVPGLKVRALLADLLAAEGRPVSGDRLVFDLWGDEPPGNPVGALQVRISQLRKALEDAEPGGKGLVVSKAPGYQLAAADVDAARFARLLSQAEAADDPRTRAGLLADALSLWRGPAYADFADEEFARAAAVRLEEQRLSALELRAEARLELGEHGLLVAELGDLVARHPLRERLRAAHLRALYRAGRQSEALAGYAELRERLAEELGLDPSPELAALHQAILNQDPALSGPARRPATNLPASLSRLIGRGEALAEVCALVREERLVTLTGTGGVGKTRLALEVAGELTEEFPDGVWLVELAPLDRRTAALPEAVMAVLDLRQDDAAAPADRLADALRSRRTLLVLDNCEHVVEQVAELAARLLRAAPGLRVLATGREPLAVDGEVLWAVPPLDLPGSTDLAVMARSDAVRLFVARAAASERGFALNAGNAQAVAQLCRRLDGIPLALELAATRVRALGVQGVVDRLDDRFRLLATGRRGAPARQRTLMAVIDWSWELLTEPERAVLRRLAVHADGCTLEAAETMTPEHDVLAVLARLVDRSLVVVVDGAAGVRYRLLESVAEYCLDRLADVGESDAVRAAHARCYLALAEQAEPHLYGHEQRVWLQRLDAESANLRAALDTAVQQGAADVALRLVNALAWYWFLRGRLAEARRALETALTAASGPVSGSVSGSASGSGSGSASGSGSGLALGLVPGLASGPVFGVGAGSAEVAAARAAGWLAGFTMLLGEEVDHEPVLARIQDPAARARATLFVGMVVLDLPTGERLIATALEACRAAGDRWGVAAALSKQARSAFARSDLETLKEIGEESARLFRELGDRWGLLQATEWLAGLAQTLADGERAKELFAEGLGLAAELGLWPEVVRRTSWLGWVAMYEGDHARAMELCGEAMRLAVSHGYREGRMMSEMGLACAAQKAGELDLAEKHLLNLLDGVPRGPGVEPALHLPTTLAALGYVTEQRGDWAAALELHREAYDACRKLGDPRTSAFTVEAMASALAAGGSHLAASRLLGVAASARARHQTPAVPSEQEEVVRVTVACREALGEPEFAAAYEQGSKLELDDAPAAAYEQGSELELDDAPAAL